jgi:hypothetical protein
VVAIYLDDGNTVNQGKASADPEDSQEHPGTPARSTRLYRGCVVIVAVVLFIAALALGAIGVAGLTGRLERNRWFGVRTPQSLRDEETFALANKVAAPTMLAAAGVLVIGGLAAVLLDGVLPIVAVIVALVAALFTIAAGGTLGSKAAGALPETSGCGTSCGACSLKGACEPA